ncbi:MAG TPA: ATP-binding protein [Patescibacteria group bacterium]|nr:ATP-binding protein [Patescibacteria group bacterium]
MRRVREMDSTSILPSLRADPALKRFATILEPGEADQPVLPRTTRGAVHQFLTEMQCEDELRAYGLEPRRTAIFSGPPGCGKTTLGHHIAARLGLPLVLVDLQMLVSSALGGTGRNIADLMTAAENHAEDCVLFFDEFDAVASKRKSAAQACDTEMNAVVIALLQRVDRFKGIMLAATNVGDEIDPALWRRFGMHLEIDLPDDDCRFAILKRYLAPLALPDDDMELLVDLTAMATPALLRQLMEAIKRDVVLSKRFERDMSASCVFGRAVAGIQPHSGSTLPELWADPMRAVSALGGIHWPPSEGAKE